MGERVRVNRWRVLIIFIQFLCSHETGAADASSLRVVYNALGATMSPA